MAYADAVIISTRPSHTQPAAAVRRGKNSEGRKQRTYTQHNSYNYYSIRHLPWSLMVRSPLRS